MWNVIRNWMKIDGRTPPVCKVAAGAPLPGPWDTPACWRRARSGDRLR